MRCRIVEKQPWKCFSSFSLDFLRYFLSVKHLLTHPTWSFLLLSHSFPLFFLSSPILFSNPSEFYTKVLFYSLFSQHLLIFFIRYFQSKRFFNMNICKNISAFSRGAFWYRIWSNLFSGLMILYRKDFPHQSSSYPKPIYIFIMKTQNIQQ